MIRISIAGAICLLGLTAANAEERRWRVDDFAEIDADGCLTLLVTAGQDYSVKATGEQAAIDRLELVRDGEVLEVEREQRNCKPDRRRQLTVTVTMPSLSKATLGAGIDAEFDGLERDDLRVEATTGAQIVMVGRCDRLRLSASTGARFDGSALICRRVDVGANTGAMVDVYAAEQVKARASLGGEIDIYGGPTAVKTSEFLGGDVDLRDS